MESVYGLFVLAAVYGLAMYVKHVRDSRRRAAVSAFAQSQGWAFVPTDPKLADRWRGTPFGEGYEREANCVLTGERNGRRFIAFDYTYVTRGSGKTGRLVRRRHHFGVVAVTLPGALPWLTVEPQNRFIAALGGADLDLESERFNHNFRVRADDERFGYAVLHPQLMEVLLRRSDVELAWRIHDYTLLGWSRGRRDPGELIPRLDLLAAIVEQVPPYVWRDYAGFDPRDQRKHG